MTGIHEGRSVMINSNDTDSITLDTALDELVSGDDGDIIQIIPYWTPASVFSEADIDEQTQFFIYNPDAEGINKSASKVFTYVSGAWVGDTGGETTAADYPLEPYQGITVRLPEGANTLELNLNGSVRMCSSLIVINASSNPNEHTLDLSLATPIALGETNLAQENQTILMAFEGNMINEASSIFYVYRSGTWFSSATYNVADDDLLMPGYSYILRTPTQAESTGVMLTPEYTE